MIRITLTTHGSSSLYSTRLLRVTGGTVSTSPCSTPSVTWSTSSLTLRSKRRRASCSRLATRAPNVVTISSCSSRRNLTSNGVWSSKLSREKLRWLSKKPGMSLKKLGAISFSARSTYLVASTPRTSTPSRSSKSSTRCACKSSRSTTHGTATRPTLSSLRRSAHLKRSTCAPLEPTHHGTVPTETMTTCAPPRLTSTTQLALTPCAGTVERPARSIALAKMTQTLLIR